MGKQRNNTSYSLKMGSCCYFLEVPFFKGLQPYKLCQGTYIYIGMFLHFWKQTSNCITRDQCSKKKNVRWIEIKLEWFNICSQVKYFACFQDWCLWSLRFHWLLSIQTLWTFMGWNDFDQTNKPGEVPYESCLYKFRPSFYRSVLMQQLDSPDYSPKFQN